MNNPWRTDGIDLGEIFRKYGPAYREAYNLPLKSLKVMGGVQKCRSEELGGHVYQCDICGHEKIAYNSCLPESLSVWSQSPLSKMPKYGQGEVVDCA